MATLEDLGFFGRPIGQNAPVGVDELGNPVYRNALSGREFGMDMGAQDPQQRAAAYIDRVRGIEGGGNALTQFNRPTAGVQARNALTALAQGALQGVTAPGRAAKGEPVTYGDAYATALDYGLLGAPMAAPEGALRANSFRAYHGSPHDFDEFRMDRIGTGEGAQAYGHGLYFAESEGVARSYRDALTANRLTTADGQAFDVYTAGGWEDFVDGYLTPRAQSSAALPQSADSFGRNSYEGLLDDAYTAIGEGTGNVKADFADMAGWLRGEGLERHLDRIRGIPNVASDVPGVLKQQYRAAADLADEISAGDLNNVPGRMYEVQINADPDTFLDWDAPLSEQPASARQVFDDNVNSYVDPRYGDEELTGEQFFRQFQQRGPQLENELRDAGVPGIRYRDAGSRGLDGAQGTRNFVVFDDAIIDIIRKYGVAGAAPMLGMTVSQLQSEMDAQGVTE